MSFICTRLGYVAYLSLLLIPSSVEAYDCAIAPIQLGITNTPLDNGVPMNRGIQVKFPGDQILGLRLSAAWNNTFISNANNCRRDNSSYNNACVGAVGSTFNPVSNDGWTPYLQGDWEAIVGHVDDPPADANVIVGVASADFDDGPTIDLPIAVWSNPKIDPVSQKGSPPSRSVLGIGRSSDLIQSFLNQSFVPSGYMGLYFGSRSLNCSEDGLITIGGWDQSRVAGPFVNYTMNTIPMNSTCPLQVWVSAMNLNNDEGSHPLITGGQKVPACVDPFQSAIGVTDALYAIWANVTRHPTEPDGPAFTDQTYPLANERLMDTLDIELEGGYNTTISHCELISLQRGANFDDIGEYSVVNTSRIQASVSYGPTDLGDNFGILLGGVFLASTYLRIDYENNQFSLAPSVVGGSPSPNVQKVCSKDISLPSKTNKTVPEASSSAESGNVATGLSADTKATIGGSVAGGVIGLMGVVITYLAYKHSKKVEKHRRESEAEMKRIQTMSTYVGTSPVPKPEDASSPTHSGLGTGTSILASEELPKPALESA
ncbi:uncharacterized protein PV09_01887 [Verruconis gallopava]|uniref:Peptidase A1 domain-containing protein n=1 Tax=Verruconis gallopava TaxID=253628 RepID=A0A0D2AMQ1_9PEZI|nr:uncharacterized protein PV09_01887 [Verruconis gallopava]KIW07988.1 hypothetical protein PV09_01887 [Verruconis gallopava]